MLTYVVRQSRDTRARNALKLRTPQARLRAFVLICKDKKVCEGGDDIDDTAAAGERSGCGNYQPKVHCWSCLSMFSLFFQAVFIPIVFYFNFLLLLFVFCR